MNTVNRRWQERMKKMPLHMVAAAMDEERPGPLVSPSVGGDGAPCADARAGGESGGNLLIPFVSLGGAILSLAALAMLWSFARLSAPLYWALAWGGLLLSLWGLLMRGNAPVMMAYALFTVDCVLVDQITKWAATLWLKGRESVPLVDDWLYLTWVRNTGAAFGLFRGYQWVFVGMAVVTVVFVVIYFRLTTERDRLVRCALLLILAGALGNMLDRIQLGYVVDFLDFHHGDFRWPVFNLADVTIDAGVFLIVLDILRDVRGGNTAERLTEGR